MMHHPKTVAQGRGQQPNARGGANQRKLGQIQPYAFSRRALSYDDIQYKVLHGGV
jgi:hypothetical protein